MAPPAFYPKPHVRVCAIPSRGGSVVKLHNGIPAFYKPKEYPKLGLPRSIHEIGGKRGVKRHLEDLIRGGHRGDNNVLWAEQVLEAIRKDCWEFFTESSKWDLTLVFDPDRTEAMARMFKNDKQAISEKFSLDLEAGRRKIGEIYPEFVRAKK